MPRLPVDGKKVIEHRITIGQYEREQLDTLVTGFTVKNVGSPIVALLSDVSALVALTGLLEIFGVIDMTGWANKQAARFTDPILGWMKSVEEGIFNTYQEAITELEETIDSLTLTPEEAVELGEEAVSAVIGTGPRLWAWINTNLQNIPFQPQGLGNVV